MNHFGHIEAGLQGLQDCMIGVPFQGTRETKRHGDRVKALDLVLADRSRSLLQVF